MNISIEELFDAGVHFGHQLRRWNPKSKPFVYDNRNGMSVIDLEKTKECLENACVFIEELVSSGKEILFVGTKRQAQEIVREVATNIRMPFAVNRWMGGCLTNFETIKRSLNKYKKYLKMESEGLFAKLHKKELAVIRREMARMHRNFEGFLELKDLPAALFVVDSYNESIAVAEANRLGIPVIALVDTNSNPELVNYPIPGNDDAVKSVRMICEYIIDAVQRGLERREEVKTKKQIKPVVGVQEFSDAEPNVTLAPDIDISETEEANEGSTSEESFHQQ